MTKFVQILCLGLKRNPPLLHDKSFVKTQTRLSLDLNCFIYVIYIKLEIFLEGKYWQNLKLGKHKLNHALEVHIGLYWENMKKKSSCLKPQCLARALIFGM